ncbi:MAG TPA: ABC transporter ATP-binding protein [Pseudonocardiaceae bacterium]|nr:ABC transporter ATP-binding protein [Pseudonocardiaceae bacterium]
MTEAVESLVLDGLTRSFGGHTALSSLNLTISGGEFVALLGPSGCGKSTALNLLAGLLAPTSGAILLNGQRIDRIPSERRDFGMVFQNYALFPHLSVADNVGFGLRVRGVRRGEREQRVRDALRLVRLADQHGKYPAQLSGGQQQRVAIARAVVTRPRLVLMDEPLSNLDAKLRLDMRTEIRLLHQELGLTTIYVTHDQQEALSLADRLVVLRDGLVQQIGTATEVYERPANPYVAGFVGYRNALSGTLRSARQVVVAGARLAVADQGLPGDGPVTVLIRPDDLLLRDEGGENGIPVLVRVCEYQGRHFAVEVSTSDGTILHCHAQRWYEPGTAAFAHARADRVRVYPLDSTAGAGERLAAVG